MKPVLDVLGGKAPNRRPVWIMRQAGRYLPEYRAVRQKAGSFLDLCYNPELACEVTLQPLRRFDLDAAILFSDILVVPHAMGQKLDFKEGEGPVLETVFDQAGVDRLGVSSDGFQFRGVFETVSRVVKGLEPGHTLIGFCGAPWTVASYMIEGGSSDRRRALSIGLSQPAWFAALIDKIVEISVLYLFGQIDAGAEVVQIFDSWAGDLPVAALQKLVISPIKRIIDSVRAVYPDFPIIVFARGVRDQHGIVARETGASAVGIENGIVMFDVLKTLPAEVAIQGNLAPELLLGSAEELRLGVERVLQNIPAQRHIFNLGHGIVPQTDPAMVARLVANVRVYDGRIN